MEILIDFTECASAEDKIEKNITKLKEHYDEIAKSFSSLTSTWIGAGGSSFGECSRKVLDETLSSIYLTAALCNQIETAKRIMADEDRALSNMMDGE